jgi:gentisate 1,2-dioxygenase
MPGFGTPLDRHGETEIFRVFEGRDLFQVVNERFEPGEGDIVSVPGGAAHAFVNISDKPSAATCADAAWHGCVRVFPRLKARFF